MERLNIFNYEGFYLDYLEGNLSKKDTALLLDFLKEHPELELLDNDLPKLSPDSFALSSVIKNDLKIIVETDPINNDTIDYFLIAEQEGLLSPEKILELNSFLSKNSKYEKDRLLYRIVQFSENEQFLYPDKDDLKHHRKMVLWPYISGIAVAVVVIILVFSGGRPKEKFVAESDLIPKQEKVFDKVNDEEKRGFNQETFESPAYVAVNTVDQTDSLDGQKSSVHELTTKTGFSVSSLRHKSSKTLALTVEPPKLEPITSNIISKKESRHKLPDDYLAINEMKDPIEPLTKQLKKRVKTDIDFRVAKPTEKKQGGFYLKIGKLEITHKSKRKK